MTICYYINKRLNFDENYFTLYHSHMFNGVGERTGAAYPLLEYKLGHDLEYPLQVSKNIFQIADIFQPNTNLIISELVKKEIQDTPNIDFLEVKFKKLFNIKYLKGRTDYPDLEKEDLMDLYPHDPTLENMKLKYYELIIPMIKSLKEKFGNKKKVELESDISLFEIELSQEMFDQYPILWQKGTFLSSESYKKLEKYINFDYFMCVPVS